MIPTKDISNGNHIHKFLRQIAIDSPQIATKVEHLIVAFSTTSEDIEDERSDQRYAHHHTLTQSERRVYGDTIESCIQQTDTLDWQQWRRDWLRDVESGQDDAFLALILAICSNIRSICSANLREADNTLRLVGIASARNRRGSTSSLRFLSKLDNLY